MSESEEVIFASLSWQELLAAAPVPEPVRQWAEEKHGLVADDPAARPVVCGYDGDGDVWVEICEAVPGEREALREVAKFDYGAERGPWWAPTGWRCPPVNGASARRTPRAAGASGMCSGAPARATELAGPGRLDGASRSVDTRRGTATGLRPGSRATHRLRA